MIDDAIVGRLYTGVADPVGRTATFDYWTPAANRPLLLQDGMQEITDDPQHSWAPRTRSTGVSRRSGPGSHLFSLAVLSVKCNIRDATVTMRTQSMELP